MLNNSGPSQNDGFPFSAQFAQPLPNQLGSGQNVYGTHNGQKALGGGRMANMQTAAQQRQRINGPLTGAPIQLQQQHYAQGQYGPSTQQPPQQRNAGPQQVTNPNAILGALGQLGRGNVPASTAAFPSLPQAQGANAPRPAGMNFAGQYGRGERVALESYLGQQQPQGALGMMPGQRGGLGQLDAAVRNGPAAINNLLHSVSQQQGKGLGVNGQNVTLGTSQPFNKMDMRSTFQPGMHLAHRLPGMVHQKPPDGASLPAGLGHAATNSNFQGDHETVFDTSDFPALGMNLNADLAASSALRNVQHIFGDSQYSGLAQLPSSPPKPAGARAPLDHSDFPALGGGQAAHNLSLPAAARAHAPAAHLAPGDAALHADGKATSQPMKAADPTKDQFGLMGLLSVIRMTDPDVTTLALGLDLQTLGLNLNATDNLHRTFGSPWSDEGRPAQLAQQLPSCYLFPPQQLDTKSMGRLTAMSLFFLFYARAGEEEQLLAAEELCKRGWHFHKTHQVWCSPVPGKVRQCVINGATGEQGLFKVFDVSTWSVQDKEDLFVDWSQCEEAPWRDRPPTLSAPTQQQTDGLAKDKDLKLGAGTDGHASSMQRYT